MKFLFYQFRRCNGCRLCELVCSLGRTGECKPGDSVIRILDSDMSGVPIPAVTGGCECEASSAPCVAACVREAVKLVEPSETGFAMAEGWIQCPFLSGA